MPKGQRPSRINIYERSLYNIESRVLCSEVYVRWDGRLEENMAPVIYINESVIYINEYVRISVPRPILP